MDPFRLTEDAIVDVDGIWLYLLEKDGVETADRIVTDLFKGFFKLADIPNAGHRRPDLTSRRVLGVLHGKRNVSRILRQRLRL